MAAHWTQSRVTASVPTGRRCATESGGREAGQARPAAADADDIRRSADGSIDVEFYKARAYAIRRATKVRFMRLLRRRAHTALKRAYEIMFRTRQS